MTVIGAPSVRKVPQFLIKSIYDINIKLKFLKHVGECRKMFMYNILAKLKRKEYYTNGIFR